MVRLKVYGQKMTTVRLPTSFQFLMVRLKADDGADQRVHGFTISIPYGSIKRETTNSQTKINTIISIPYGSIKRKSYASSGR